MKDRGFTLIEVMIAIFIMALISIALWGAFRQTILIREQIMGRDFKLQTARIVMSRLRADIGSTFIKPNKENAYVHFVGDKSGDFDKLKMSTFSHSRYIQDTHESDQAQISYFMDTDKDGKARVLKRKEVSVIRKEEDNVKGVEYILINGLEKLNFKYCDGQKSEWKDDWDSQKIDYLDRLPLAIQVSIEFKKDPTDEAPFKYEDVIIVESEFSKDDSNQIVMKGCPLNHDNSK